MQEDQTKPVLPTVNRELKGPLIFTLVSAIVFLLLGLFGVFFLKNQNTTKPEVSDFKKFASEEELRDYLGKGNQNYGIQSLGGFSQFATPELAKNSALEADQRVPSGDRVSETNVQVQGLDEPDIVKTDGKNIYFSSENFIIYDRGFPLMEAEDSVTSKLIAPDTTYPVDYPKPETKIISALPPESIKLDSKVEANGNLLLDNNILMVFAYNKINAFDISDPKKPQEAWSYEYEENYAYNSARLVDGKLYLVSTRYTYDNFPCPVPFLKGQENVSIPCLDIYRPSGNIASDTMYSVVKIATENGKVENSLSFLGSSGSSVVYMSPNSIYATFTSSPDILKYISDFLSQNADLLGQTTSAKIANLNNLDISSEAKAYELGIIIQKYLSGLPLDDRKKLESDLENKMSSYLKDHARELQTTSIVKINKDTFAIAAKGEVPGQTLNQFSLDEYDDNLRIVTTLSPSGMWGRVEPVNDLYVLGSGLKTKGKIEGLAEGEKVFSARFIDDKAYVVTFKQVDPFFVFDLKDPSSPKLAGELKIPGYSSYLHPLNTNIVLGVGQEEGKTKLSLFDVTDPGNPIEKDKYNLNEYWSEVSNNHHAFLFDQKNGVFFLPAGASGYIFSFANGLELKRAVGDISARRALYINNYMYIIGDNKIVVLDEANWQEISHLEF